MDVGKNAQISYSMKTSGSEGRIRFSIDSHNGAIILSDRLTSEDVNSTHQLLITATDAGSPVQSTTVQLLIKVKLLVYHLFFYRVIEVV
jgi:Cadherin domain